MKQRLVLPYVSDARHHTLVHDGVTDGQFCPGRVAHSPERLAGVETGVKAVQSYTGEAVWQEGRDGEYSRDQHEAAI